MRARQGTRPALRLVETAVRPAEVAWFCGHCASPAPGNRAPEPAARVCTECGLGLLLETRVEAVPAPDDAFLVVDRALRVQALSDRAQTLLALSEEDAVNRPVASLLVGADTGTESSSLAAAVVAAAGGSGDPLIAFVRPWNTFGVRMRARIAPCGPPRAALIVLTSPARQRLRAVD